MIFAYADPPYIGQAKKHYDSEEVDHKELLRELTGGLYGGWALSCSSPSLQEILALCPTDVRVGAWVKPFCSFKANVNPAYAWGPVIFWGGKKRTREQPTMRDWVSENITLKRGLSGAKPDKFSFWVFSCLGAGEGDRLIDMFPGTGAVEQAWDIYRDKQEECEETVMLYGPKAKR
tara:strand:- start:11604 stop:12131 length:528 start_codon:yes stop_codon:yes gene_type:complete